MDPLKHVGVISLALFSPVLQVPRTMLQNMQVRTRDLETTTDEAQSPSPGNKGACAIHFFWRPYSTASFSSSFSMVFLPSRRCSSLIYFTAAASSEAGTTSSPAMIAVRLPSRYCFRQAKIWFAFTP